MPGDKIRRDANKSLKKQPLSDIKNINEKWVAELSDFLKEKNKVNKQTVLFMIEKMRSRYETFKTLTNIEIQKGQKLNLIGDIHGQFYDLLKIFLINGKPSATNLYIFNGDFVDRGSYSVEVMICLMAYNLLYPNYVFLNRGNHECEEVTTLYG